jgi:signal transduction histidine kinase
MSDWFRGKRAGLVAFGVIALLVAGGLGWVTAAAVRLEREQQSAQAQSQVYDNLRLALWRLDSRISPLLAREDSRPYTHFRALYAPPLAITKSGLACGPGTVFEPSPLLNAELPDWMLLHFQADPRSGWESPRVLSASLAQRLDSNRLPTPDAREASRCGDLLAALSAEVSAESLLASVRRHGEQPTVVDRALLLPDATNNTALLNQAARQMQVDPEYLARGQTTNLRSQKAAPQKAEKEVRQAVEKEMKAAKDQPPAELVAFAQGPMTPLWLATRDGGERLVVARWVEVGDRQFCQGILLDWPRLQTLLTSDVNDLFPDARALPMREEVPPHPERTMTALPVELDPGPLATAEPASGWTPLRVGLALAWLAALVALAAVGLGGWSLLDLSERRIRFVAAVTHELRTPLTTLRLYLDMLAGGMVRAEKQKDEYIQTLNDEADRLHRLVANVLDFSRLEDQRPRPARSEVRLGELLEQVRSAWQGRCAHAGKELLVESELPADDTLLTDGRMVGQVLGNLIENACKYAREAADPHIWLRARAGRRGWVVLEVEDRGPGVPIRERRSIFRPFRRGRGVDATAGGAGLGLALARRWSQALGGRLMLRPGEGGAGACFRLELPQQRAR